MRKQLAEYRAEMRRRHGKQTAVRVVADRGWVRGPTGHEFRPVTLELSGPGFKTKLAYLTAERDGTFSVR